MSTREMALFAAREYNRTLRGPAAQEIAPKNESTRNFERSKGISTNRPSSASRTFLRTVTSAATTNGSGSLSKKLVRPSSQPPTRPGMFPLQRSASGRASAMVNGVGYQSLLQRPSTGEGFRGKSPSLLMDAREKEKSRQKDQERGKDNDVLSERATRLIKKAEKSPSRSSSLGDEELVSHVNSSPPSSVASPPRGHKKGSRIQSSNSDKITIHVRDENRKIEKDFYCKKDLLIEKMKYFESYLSGADGYDDIDISVHCDINVFEWLMRYMERGLRSETGDAQSPDLTAGNVVSILISSHFLRMEPLVEACLQKMKDVINEVLRLPIDLSCINDHLVQRLGNFFDPLELDGIVDPKDKLLSKFYMLHLQKELKRGTMRISRCRLCKTLYHRSQYKEKGASVDGQVARTCRSGKKSIDARGALRTTHIPSKNFSLKRFLIQLR